MLERIALHQTRLHVPGLSLDAKGVALGDKGLVLFPTIDRLVAFLGVYTRDRSLEDLMPSLAIRVVRSKLGMRELVLEVASESSDRMDRLAETARLVGGFTFTGTSRHHVQYRDASAPFGFDAPELLPAEATFVLYHSSFSQAYDEESTVNLRELLLRLMPRVEPATRGTTGPRIVVAEPGIGPALVHYFVRSRVEGDVGVGEWPPASSFDDEPVRRWILRVPELPPRMTELIEGTPGITCFLPVAPGVAVEAGFAHPIELRACPVFDAAGLVLLRGRGEPWSMSRLPPMGAFASLSKVELRGTSGTGPTTAAATAVVAAEGVTLPLRVVPSSAPWRGVSATWVPVAQLPLLRKLAYALPRTTVARTTIAMTDRGALVRSPGGVEAIPLGTYYVEAHPDLYLPAGCEIAPAVAPAVLARALGVDGGRVMFLGVDGRGVAVEPGAFVPLEAALLEAPPWDAATVEAIETSLEDEPLDLAVTSLGLLPLRGVEPPSGA